MPRTVEKSTHTWPRWWPMLVVVLAAVHLYCPPTRVAELEVVPDSVEYAVAAHRFATTGKYEIRVNGRALPPRYPPGFSVLLLAPAYAIAPGNIGNGIVIVWAAGILAALFACLIADKLAGPWGGVLAAVFLLLHPEFSEYSRYIVTDVPALALGLAACWLFLRLRGQADPPWREYWIAGVIVGLSMALRPLTGLLVFPFLFDVARRRPRGALPRLIALGIPGAIVVAITSYQQWLAFGDWHRTGYQFWLAVPYDYLSLTFSPRNLKDNLELFGWSPKDGARAVLLVLPMVLGAIGTVALLNKRTPSLTRLLLFLLLTALPLSFVHLFYFFRDVRFHFLLIALMDVLGGAGIAVLIPQTLRQKGWPVLALLGLAILGRDLFTHPAEDPKPYRYHVATVCDKLLPSNAILISGVDPDYLEQMVARRTSRHILPIDRATPYANSVLSWHRVAAPNPPPRNAADNACAGLVNGGAEKLYAFTADEEIDQLRSSILADVPIYLELKSRKPDDPAVQALSNAFRFVPVSPAEPWLVRLAWKSPDAETFADVVRP